MFTELEKVYGTILKWHEVVVHKNIFRDCVKHVEMQRCHIAQWHDGVKLKTFREVGMSFRKPPYRTPHMENNTVQLLASLLLIADGLRMS